MANREQVKQPMPTQDAAQRSRNFDEVALGYTQEMAMAEAERCLQCPHKPCVGGCPVAIDIPGFIKPIAEGDMQKAFDVLSEQTNLPAVCGRVCPQETQCEALCVRGRRGEAVAIGRLERYAADWNMQHSTEAIVPPPSNGHKVAVVGAGPAGLTVAGDLAKKGYQITVFEALHKPGGVLVYGIPEFRLPKAIVEQEINHLEQLGATVKTNMVVGKVLTIDELFEDGYKAVFIASGAGLPRFMGIPGENYNGVFSANDFLTRVNLMEAWKPDSRTPVMRANKVTVVGGGNVAMDAARCAKRLGADDVTIVYRRSMEELPARKEEVDHAVEEGIVFQMLTNPKEILANEEGWVTGMRCVRSKLGEPDESGRARPIEIEGSDFIVPTESVIMAIGTSPNPLIRTTTPGLEADRWGRLVTDGDDGLTSRPGVFAGGDVVTGSATVILAMGAGKDAAEAIDTYIKENYD